MSGSNEIEAARIRGARAMPLTIEGSVQVYAYDSLGYEGKSYLVHTENEVKPEYRTHSPGAIFIDSEHEPPEAVATFARSNAVALYLASVEAGARYELEVAHGDRLDEIEDQIAEIDSELWTTPDGNGNRWSKVGELREQVTHTLRGIVERLAAVETRVAPTRAEINQERTIASGQRWAILTRDGFRCTYCGAGREAGELKVDHIIPVSKGGKSHPDNLTTACGPCNAGKSARLVAV